MVQRIDRDLTEVMGEEPVPPTSHDEVGAYCPRQVCQRKVVVVGLGLEQRQIVPRKIRHREVALKGDDRRRVDRRRGRLIGVAIDHEPRLRHPFTGSQRRLSAGVSPSRLGARIGGAILVYLAEKTGSPLWPADPQRRSQVLQWLMFQMAGVGPMQGQAHVFVRYAPERIEYAVKRYTDEVKRLYTILDRRLEGRDYLCDEYSVADIATWPWVRIHFWVDVSIDDLPNLQRWYADVSGRPSAKAGY